MDKSKKTKKYHVGFREVWVRTIEVEAPNEKAAIEKAWLAMMRGQEKEISWEYSHYLDDEYTVVEEVNE